MSLKNQELKMPLAMNTTVMEIQAEKEETSAFIVRYNQVIKAYNQYSEGGSAKMQVMVGNGFISKISQYLSKPLYLVAFALVIVLIPIANVFCLVCILTYLLYLKRENKKHERNLSRVHNPFENFFFMPQMCEHMGKHHTTLNLAQNQIEGFTFNEQLRNKLSHKLHDKKSLNSSQKLTVLIYDQYFYDSFHLYRKEFYKTLILATFGVVLLGISVVLYVSFFFEHS